ncbi:hypothetical protein E2C01_093845 [Portunus trituberculatus]|uniref:Uncharacterized protein n=1 Tax=Portunus trituberculatus TaxID=210409 RepID=A0A5B7JQX0_PORTR|nr:hypothetical protein [Portunus trituberculatus]
MRGVQEQVFLGVRLCRAPPGAVRRVGHAQPVQSLLEPCRMCVTASSAPKVRYAVVMCSGYNTVELICFL